MPLRLPQTSFVVRKIGIVPRGLSPTIGSQMGSLKYNLCLLRQLRAEKGHGPYRPGPENKLRTVTTNVISNFLFCATFVLNLGTVPGGLKLSKSLFFCATFVLKMGTVPSGLAPMIRFKQ